MTAYLTVEHDNLDFANGDGAYGTLAEFEISYTVTQTYPGTWDEPEPSGGEIENVELTLITFERDFWSNPARLAGLTEFQRACLIEWATHNRDTEINAAIEDNIFWGQKCEKNSTTPSAGRSGRRSSLKA